ncbi:unnamed protein product [Prorocentrum cordatum]|uniref:Uncharacterized protein n=1 Tax=Prorocentrum cordatum TaxID=2364126 RepID=A0ABN9W8Y8_9DINO|nr:unnamed protein product [Polarella glacialis]
MCLALAPLEGASSPPTPSSGVARGSIGAGAMSIALGVGVHSDHVSQWWAEVETLLEAGMSSELAGGGNSDMVGAASLSLAQLVNPAQFARAPLAQWTLVWEAPRLKWRPCCSLLLEIWWPQETLAPLRLNVGFSDATRSAAMAASETRAR